MLVFWSFFMEFYDMIDFYMYQSLYVCTYIPQSGHFGYTTFYVYLMRMFISNPLIESE